MSPKKYCVKKNFPVHNDHNFFSAKFLLNNKSSSKIVCNQCTLLLIKNHITSIFFFFYFTCFCSDMALQKNIILLKITIPQGTFYVIERKKIVK